MRSPLVVPAGWPAVLALLLPLLLMMLPAPALAQPGWYYLPDLTLSETFDDNLFGSSTRPESDFITRLTSALKVGYRSKPLTFLATSAFDGEIFAKHPDSNGLNRTQSGIEVQWLPDPRLTLRLDGAFTKTETPSELVSNLGLELGRQTSTELSVTPSLSYRLRRTTFLEAGYAYHLTEAGDVTSTTQEPRARVAEQVTRVDLASITYAFRIVDSGNSSVSSNLVVLGWARRLSPTTAVILEAGPRFSEGGVDAEVNASLSHRWAASVEATLGYSRAQITIPTQSGVSNTQALTAYVAAVPLRSLTVALTASVSEVSQKPDDTLSEGAGLAAVYRLTKWLSVIGSYRFNHSATGGTSTFHSLVSVGLQARYPTRLDD